MSVADDALGLIDRDQLVQLALEICNIDSAGPFEAEVAEFIYQWLRREGFIARRIGLLKERFNVLGTACQAEMIFAHSAAHSLRNLRAPTSRCWLSNE